KYLPLPNATRIDPFYQVHARHGRRKYDPRLIAVVFERPRDRAACDIYDLDVLNSAGKEECSIVWIRIEIGAALFAGNSGNGVGLSSEHRSYHEAALHVGILLPGAAREHENPVAGIVAFIQADFDPRNDRLAVANVKDGVVDKQGWLEGKVHELILCVLGDSPSQHTVDGVLRRLAVIVAVNVKVETLAV